MTPQKITVAIDGPSGAGKSTVAKLLAVRLRLPYIDTGAMYRALGFSALKMNIETDDCQKLGLMALAMDLIFSEAGSKVSLNGEDVSKAIRDPEVSSAASAISRCAEVRAAMLELQRSLATNGGVMEGRDIGSVVLPGATLKVYLDASIGERVRRRTEELKARKIEQSSSQVEKEMKQRDHADQNRKQAPLVRLPEALYIDSTGVSIDEILETILDALKKTDSA